MTNKNENLNNINNQFLSDEDKLSLQRTGLKKEEYNEIIKSLQTQMSEEDKKNIVKI